MLKYQLKTYLSKHFCSSKAQKTLSIAFKSFCKLSFFFLNKNLRKKGIIGSWMIASHFDLNFCCRKSSELDLYDGEVDCDVFSNNET